MQKSTNKIHALHPHRSIVQSCKVSVTGWKWYGNVTKVICVTNYLPGSNNLFHHFEITVLCSGAEGQQAEQSDCISLFLNIWQINLNGTADGKTSGKQETYQGQTTGSFMFCLLAIVSIELRCGRQQGLTGETEAADGARAAQTEAPPWGQTGHCSGLREGRRGEVHHCR